MPKLSRTPKTKPALPSALAAHRMMTIDEACAAAGISRRGFLNLRKAGQGPALTRFGSVIRISQEAFAEWRQRMTGEAA